MILQGLSAASLARLLPLEFPLAAALGEQISGRGGVASESQRRLGRADQPVSPPARSRR